MQSRNLSQLLRISSLGSSERKITNILFVSMDMELALAVYNIISRISRSSSSMQQTVIETMTTGKMSVAPMSFAAYCQKCVRVVQFLIS